MTGYGQREFSDGSEKVSLEKELREEPSDYWICNKLQRDVSNRQEDLTLIVWSRPPGCWSTPHGILKGCGGKDAAADINVVENVITFSLIPWRWLNEIVITFSIGQSYGPDILALARNNGSNASAFGLEKKTIGSNSRYEKDVYYKKSS
jgi:hypothetical protein